MIEKITQKKALAMERTLTRAYREIEKMRQDVELDLSQDVEDRLEVIATDITRSLGKHRPL